MRSRATVPTVRRQQTPGGGTLRLNWAVSFHGMACACCGRDSVQTVALQSQEHVSVCRDCVEWLAGKLGVVSTPTLPVVNLAEAVEFYERAGFGVRVYPDDSGDGFAFADYDGQSVFDLDVVDIDPARNG